MTHSHNTISQAALIALLHRYGGELTITNDLIDDMVAHKFGVLIKEDGKRGNWILSYAKPEDVTEFFKDKHCTCVDPTPEDGVCTICHKPITPIIHA